MVKRFRVHNLSFRCHRIGRGFPLCAAVIGIMVFATPMTPAASPAGSWERSDPHTYAAIRDEGLGHSQAMRFASELADGIGGRLMGSPNMRKAYDWSLSTLEALGMSNVHLEDIGEFGLSWRQNNTWMRMSSPDSMQFIAQAAPWSVSSNGPLEGDVVPVEISNDADIAKYRGKLSGKIVFLGPPRDVLPPLNPSQNDSQTSSYQTAVRSMRCNITTRRALNISPP